MPEYKKVSYSKLNSKQKENYNFHNLASLLASYGFNSIWLNDDVQGADFLAVSNSGEIYKVQLKGRLTFDKKYIGKNLYVAFPSDDGFYFYKHDSLLKKFETKFKTTQSWKERGNYSFNKISADDQKKMKKYFISEASKIIIF